MANHSERIQTLLDAHNGTLPRFDPLVGCFILYIGQSGNVYCSDCATGSTTGLIDWHMYFKPSPIICNCCERSLDDIEFDAAFETLSTADDE